MYRWNRIAPYAVGTAVLAAGVAVDLQPQVMAWVDACVHSPGLIKGMLAMQAYIVGPPAAAYAAAAVTGKLCRKGGLEECI